MTADGLPREWEPAPQERVVDRQLGTEGRQGVVVNVQRYGHFADPWWRATVHWDDGVEEYLNTIWITRPDGSQGGDSPEAGR